MSPQTILAKAATGFLRNPEGSGFPGSRNFSSYTAAPNPELIAGIGAALGRGGGAGRRWCCLCPACSATSSASRSSWPARHRARRASHGVNPTRLVVLLHGHFRRAGRAGGAVRGDRPGRADLASTSTSGYGFTAIIVAFLGRLNPLGIVLAGLLMALTYVGGEMAATNLGLPSAAIQVFQGMLLFFLLGVDVLIKLPDPADAVRKEVR